MLQWEVGNLWEGMGREGKGREWEREFDDFLVVGSSHYWKWEVMGTPDRFQSTNMQHVLLLRINLYCTNLFLWKNSHSVTCTTFNPAIFVQIFSIFLVKLLFLQHYRVVPLTK